MSKNIIIKCEDLHHNYPSGVSALQGVDLAIAEREIVGVIGQNGSGKTTLVKHFNGLLKPTSGQVFVKGINTREAEIKEISRHAGYVFQNPNHQLFAGSVRKELEFGPANIGMSAEEIEERVRLAADFFGLEEFLDENPYRLSFPLRKTVGIASIYAMDPEIFILDEPTTGLDYTRARMVAALIKKLQDEGRTVLVVSHDMMLIAECCARVIVLWNSRLIGDGTPREIFGNRELLEKTNLAPPQIFRMAEEIGLQHNGKTPLSVDEAVEAVERGERAG